MRLTTHTANPFAMMLDPERVARAVEHSERLNRLHSRVYRPLDKPLIPKALAAAAEFDDAVDAEPEIEAEEGAEQGAGAV